MAYNDSIRRILTFNLLVRCIIPLFISIIVLHTDDVYPSSLQRFDTYSTYVVLVRLAGVYVVLVR